MARNQAVYVTCDSCRKAGEVETLSDLPENWYHVALPNPSGKIQPTANGFDFCALICMEKWAKARRKVKGEVRAPGAYVKVKCEFCDNECAPQGMKMHVADAHSEIFADWMESKKVKNGQN